MPKKKTHEQFLEEIKDRPFEVIEGIYSGNKVKLKFKCKVDGHKWFAIPSTISRGTGCPRCSGKLKKTHEEFLNEIKDRNFEIAEGVYVSNHTKLKFKCKIDGWEWSSEPNHILHGSGCPKCGYKSSSKKQAKTPEEFLNEIKDRSFEVVNGVYVNARSKLKFKCKIDGWEWWSAPTDILSGYACPKCNSSKGELAVENWLKERNVYYEIQKRFSNCRNTNPLPFDFYLPELNICVEFDGEQHNRPVSFGSKKSYSSVKYFIRVLINDEIKDSYCKSHGIKLIRIAYNEDVTEKLNKEVIINAD